MEVMTENAGTAAADTEAQSPEAAVAPDAGTQAPDEVTTLRSRNAGLDAKVTELTKAQKAAEKAALDAQARLADYEAGRVGADEALRAQLSVKDAELEAIRREVQVARVAGQYPETFALFGDAVASMAPDVLAASEARLKGAGFDAVPETPRPVGANPQKPTAPTQKAIEDMSRDELRAYMRTFDNDILSQKRD